MTFMIQIKKLVDGTFAKGTSEYATETEAMIALHVAMASAMQKDDTQSIVCLLTDEFGSQKKREYFVRTESQPEPVDEVQE